MQKWIPNESVGLKINIFASLADLGVFAYFSFLGTCFAKCGPNSNLGGSQAVFHPASDLDPRPPGRRPQRWPSLAPIPRTGTWPSTTRGPRTSCGRAPRAGPDNSVAGGSRRCPLPPPRPPPPEPGPPCRQAGRLPPPRDVVLPLHPLRRATATAWPGEAGGPVGGGTRSLSAMVWSLQLSPHLLVLVGWTSGFPCSPATGPAHKRRPIPKRHRGLERGRAAHPEDVFAGVAQTHLSSFLLSPIIRVVGGGVDPSQTPILVNGRTPHPSCACSGANFYIKVSLLHRRDFPL